MLNDLRARFATVAAAAPRAYWYVWWGTLVNRLGGFVVPLLTIYLTTVRRLEVDVAGGIVSLFGAGNVLASIVGGQLSDRLGRKATMVISLFGGAAAMATLAFVREPEAVAVMITVLGFVGELYRPAVGAFVADVIPAEHRVAAYGLLHWVINVGFAFAAMVGGLLAELDFTMLFLADGATMAIYGVIVLVAVPETRPPRAPRVTAPSRSWITDRELVVFVLLTFGFVLLPMQAGATLSAHMTWQGFSPAAYGFIMAVNGVVIIALQPLLTTWSARFDPSRVLAAATLCSGVGMVFHGLAGSLVVHVVAVLFWTFGEILDTPTRSAIAADLAPDDARGRYQGAIVMAWGAAQLVGPKLGTWVWVHESPLALWLGCAALSVVVAAAIVATAPARRRRASARSRSESS